MRRPKRWRARALCAALSARDSTTFHHSSTRVERRLTFWPPGPLEREKRIASGLPEHSVRILDHAREHGRVRIGEMIKLTGVSRNTLKEHFRQLVEKG